MTFLMNIIQNLIQTSKSAEQNEPYYEVLQYIALSGNEYFDTGDYGNQNTTWEVECRATNTSNYGVVIGARTSTTQSRIDLIYNTDGTSGWIGFGTNTNNTYNFKSIPANVRHNFKCDEGKVYIDGEFKATISHTNFETPATLKIGCEDTNGTLSMGFIGELYVLKLNGSDYLPVLDSQMRPCLYDKVSKTFLYAKKIADGTDATSTLTYKRWNKFDVDYIENTGTAYIPFVDITPSATMGMNIEYAYTVLSSAEPAGVIGTYNGDTQRKDTFFVSTSSGYTQKASSPSSASCGVMVFHRGGNVGTSSATSATYVEPEKDVWYTATVNWLGDGEIYWTDGTNELSANVGANAVVTNQLRLFSRCNSANSTYNNCKSRVRKLQFSDGSNIIRSYKPTVWHNGNTTAIATLYDEVYNKMCTPSGSLKAYITTSEVTVYNLLMGTQNDDYYLGEEGVKTASSDHTSCYTNAIPVRAGDVVEWTVTAEAVTAHKRIHGYTTNADITTGQKGSWVEMLAKLSFGTALPTTQTATFTVPSGVNYIRLSHANVRESGCTVTIRNSTTPFVYEVGSNCSATPDGVVGTSNCFDTGIYGNQDMQVKLISYLPTNTQATGQLFGSYDGSEATSKNYTINTTNTQGTAGPIRFDGKVITTPIKKGNTKIAIVDNKLGIWVDNDLHGSWNNPSDFTTTTTLLILKCNNSSNVRQNGCCYCLIEENQIPIAEYIPVKNASNSSSYGLYDRVSGTLNIGVGTITFNALS